MARLKEVLQEEFVPALMEQFGYKIADAGSAHQEDRR